MSRVQDDEVGDGTTSVTVLAAELLRVSLCEQLYLRLIVFVLWFRISEVIKSLLPTYLVLVSVFHCLSIGSRIFNCKEDSSADHHCRLERSHKGGKTGSVEFCSRSWVGN